MNAYFKISIEHNVCKNLRLFKQRLLHDGRKKQATAGIIPELEQQQEKAESDHARACKFYSHFHMAILNMQ
jgi:hypothetical protein